MAQSNAVPAATPRLPCVILIVADGLGYGDLGCYGQKAVATPHLDALAKDGVRFSDFHAGGTSDMTARASLMTGQDAAATTGLRARTLAERLKTAGYVTGFIGYWGLGEFHSSNAPQRRGFDVVVAYGDRQHAWDLYAGHLFRKDPRSGFEGRVPLVGNPHGAENAYLPDLLTQAAVRFCRLNEPKRLNSYRPFFLMLSYPVPAAVVAQSGPVPEVEASAGREWTSTQKDRANAIGRLDQNVGELLDELEKRGMDLNTLVFITSALGPVGQAPSDLRLFGSTGPFILGDQPLAEGRLRVPLIVRWPFWMKTGRASDLLLTGTDIVPTVLEAARVDVPEALDGISFLPTLQGQAQTNRHEYLIWQALADDGRTDVAVRQGQWKGVQTGTEQSWQLFDLAADPGEQTDLAKQRPELLEELKAKLPKRPGNGAHSSGASEASHVVPAG
ncbi:MAG: sulfatase-like hydrolase/transferase [Verrucomicrobia bacterium]|nr:sulfatase-like hydrolase/transferase [Verrucomicrobiota bacterium]